MWRACVWRQVYLFMPRARAGISRTGNKQIKARARKNGQTSPQAVEAEAEAVAEAEAPAEAAEQASLAVLDENAGCDGRKRVRFDRLPPRPTGIRHVLPVSGPWTWGGRWNFPTDHPAWSRNRTARLGSAISSTSMAGWRWKRTGGA